MSLESTEQEECKPNPDGLFHKELASLLNKYSKEGNSNTPDFILATYIESCLRAYEEAVHHRDNWYNIHPAPGGVR